MFLFATGRVQDLGIRLEGARVLGGRGFLRFVVEVKALFCS